jgi:hypothetical protein
LDRAVVIVLIGLAANAALDFSGYENDWWAATAWLLAVLGVAYLLWPSLLSTSSSRSFTTSRANRRASYSQLFSSA